LTANFISAGKTLVESIEVFVKSANKDAFKKYKEDCLSKEYDDNFYYRFLRLLRNYSQHGHLIVRVFNENNIVKCCFDISQILETPHFKFNESLKKEMESIEELVVEKFNDNPRWVFTISLAQFNLSVLRIYKAYYDTIEMDYLTIINKFKNFEKSKVEFLSKPNEKFKGYLFFRFNDGSVHAVDFSFDYEGKLTSNKGISYDELSKHLKIYDETFSNKATRLKINNN